MFKISLLLLALITLSVSLQGVTELTDSNFKAMVSDDESYWLVLFAAEWCGHCKALKPEIEKLAPRLNELGVKVGHVGEKNNKLVNDHVVDHKTHMVSYPKMKIFLGKEMLGNVPSSLRQSDQIYQWFVQEYMSEAGASQSG